jgi:hypothetical protein
MGDKDLGDPRSALDRRAFLGVAAGAVAVTALTDSSAAVPVAGTAGGEYIGAPPAAYYGADDPQVPKVGLRWAFSATVFFADRITINAAILRGCTSVAGGEVWGPRLQGRVLPSSGADYFKGVLPGPGHSGSSGFNTYYMLEAADGAPIFIHNRGTVRRFKGPPEPGKPLQPAAATDPPGQVYTRFRAMPVFTAPIGPHDWMNRTVFVAHLQRQSNPDHSVFTYYEVL